MRPRRLTAAAAFAAAGLIAAAAHVLLTDPQSLRLWRETLPLAAGVGAALGALVRPAGWRQGAALALLAIPAFALAYATAETAMAATRREVTTLADWPASIVRWTGTVLQKALAAGGVAVVAGAVAGRVAGQSR